MGNANYLSKLNIEKGAYLEPNVPKDLNQFQKIEYSMPFHTMDITTYECRIKKFIIGSDTVNLN